MMKRMIYAGLIAGMIGMTACSRQGCTDPGAINYDSNAKKDDGSCLFEDTDELVVPSTYTFVDAEGNSTVSFNGQKQRLEMLTELSSYIKSANTPGVTIDAQQMKDMYANDGFSWTDDAGLGMTGSSKNLKSKTAASSGVADPFWQGHIEAIFDEVAGISVTTLDQVGEQGVAGVVVSTTNPTKQYLQNAQGFEPAQLVEKTLMGAVFLNQTTLWYLADDQINVDNSSAVDPDQGKYYTQMEHHWDEAYGYFTSEEDYPSNGTDRFWGKYANGREALLGSASRISEAFRTGRAAISSGNMSVRDAQIAIIRSELNKVSAASAIHYVNAALGNANDDALRNHELSEAHAFILALKFGYQEVTSNTEIDGWLDHLGDDFYSVSIDNLNQVRSEIADAFGLNDIVDEL